MGYKSSVAFPRMIMTMLLSVFGWSHAHRFSMSTSVFGAQRSPTSNEPCICMPTKLRYASGWMYKWARNNQNLMLHFLNYHLHLYPVITSSYLCCYVHTAAYLERYYGLSLALIVSSQGLSVLRMKVLQGHPAEHHYCW
jgi:hypothetical protein